MALLKDYRFDLPENLIAQTPAEKRDASRLMVLDKKTGAMEHRHFCDIVHYLRAGDVLVVNESKVFPARLIGEKEGTGAAVELLLLENMGGDVWEAIMKPGRKGKKGAAFCFGGGRLRAEVLQGLDDGKKLVEFFFGKGERFSDLLEEIGKAPLPPYIKESESSADAKERYQTVYANPGQPGSAAAPTAGLHFTPELLDSISAKGVAICPITLHVGLGTFRPVKTEDIAGHKMHEERYRISERSASEIAKAKSEGRRVVAVGTTSCRALEGNFAKYGKITPCEDKTGIFIYGKYDFAVADALITNFHLPESTLLMLVSAFCSREKILEAYKTAVENKYRFFSFGDAMLII
ncbi:MAG: tRNA preQ1(34) S-adenosylmethionine ribosyltransferase-isomerase QueA [Oscillospiraceae bacterium]|nr:tRNA preQ1(34) S-adenosylmethionine ribosyltransferase-isomerase QueA [Oscillospiraceae bacterium]